MSLGGAGSPPSARLRALGRKRPGQKITQLKAAAAVDPDLGVAGTKLGQHLQAVISIVLVANDERDLVPGAQLE